ncbi:hypothetical protein GH714_040296 [Hevea brasiliensis]|uniref:Pectinesterase inhibitor domain-containing protein n=1 Tax=Hevea brasiliensis TaxID=3981 RepID=A0A6A6MUZ2_HEVBR|nr:hypothetical protein GH714_040296 [Hevea brasiliensis]
MATKIRSLAIFFIFLLSSIFFSAESKSSKASNIAWWCNETPHPETCKYFVNQRHQHFAPNHRSEFRNIMVQLALERALGAQRQVFRLKPKCQSHDHRAVWIDCFKLHADTIVQLNRTLQGIQTKNGCTNFDAQTWLSTALTNIQTCRTGSLDFNVSDFIMPIMSNNLSELISNSLALNGVLLSVEDNNTEGFPRWFSRNERRLLQSSSITAKANLVVAQDGSGHFRTVQAALDAAAKRRYGTRFIIHVKRGVYRENIEVGINNNNIWLIGDGLRSTIIASGRSVGGGYTTYSSATGIDGLRFVARGITFSNTAAVVFQNCIIYVRKPLNGQANMITAQARNDPFQNTGIAIHNSQILPAPDLKPVAGAFQTYLGRPWMQYSRTVVLKTYLDGFINPAGWSQWGNGNFALDTLYYGEYKNFGPGSSTKQRVTWKGFHVITSSIEASRFTVASLIAGQSWLPATGVPFISGL